MKKVLSLILALAMVFALVACGEKQPASDGDASGDGDKPARGNVIMTFGTADTGGSMYPAGAAVSQVWTNNVQGVKCNTQTSTGSFQNCQDVSTGEVDVAVATSDVVLNAYNGTGKFADIGKLDNLRVIGAVYTSVLSGVALKSSGLTYIHDLLGKRVAVGPAASATENATLAAFAAMDITKDNTSLENLGLGDGAARERKAAWDADAESKRNASLEAAVREEGKRADRERVKSETLLASVEADMKSNAKEMHEKEEASAAQIAKLEKELQKTKSERDAFERKLKRHKLFAEVLETMEATIQKLTKVIAAPSAVADPSSREKILRQQVTDMSTSLTQLNTTVHKVQKLVVFGDKKNDQLQEEVLAQQKQAETQREELETQRTALETAQKEAKEAKEDAARLRSANESLEKAAQRLSDEVGGLRAELLEMVTGEDSFQARWKKESAENERLRARVAELGKEAANWRLDVKKERIRFERRLIASRSSEEKEVLELMQEEMQRYKAELLCPVCHRAPKDCILCKCQHIFCRECVEERISVRERRRRDV